MERESDWVRIELSNWSPQNMTLISIVNMTTSCGSQACKLQPRAHVQSLKGYEPQYIRGQFLHVAARVGRYWSSPSVEPIWTDAMTLSEESHDRRASGHPNTQGFLMVFPRTPWTDLGSLVQDMSLWLGLQAGAMTIQCYTFKCYTCNYVQICMCVTIYICIYIYYIIVYYYLFSQNRPRESLVRGKNGGLAPTIFSSSLIWVSQNGVYPQAWASIIGEILTISGRVPNFHTKPYIHVHMYVYIYIYIMYIVCICMCISLYIYLYIFTENCRMAIAFTRRDTAGTTESNCFGQACGSSHKKPTEVEGLSNGYVKSLGT